MILAEALGYLAAVLVLVTFWMKAMIPLRLVALTSNVVCIAYGLLLGLAPVLILHAILLPLNAYRLIQMRRLVKETRAAATGDLSLEPLLPFMTRRRFAQGEVLFRKGDLASEMFYILSGRIRLREINVRVGEGDVLGEISMFSPSKERTATAIAETSGELLAMSDDKVLQLYYQNPKFGLHLVQLITRRLIENCAMIESAADRRLENLPRAS